MSIKDAAELATLRAQRDAGMFAAIRLEFEERWGEGDMGGDEVWERLRAMLK